MLNVEGSCLPVMEQSVYMLERLFVFIYRCQVRNEIFGPHETEICFCSDGLKDKQYCYCSLVSGLASCLREYNVWCPDLDLFPVPVVSGMLKI